MRSLVELREDKRPRLFMLISRFLVWETGMGESEPCSGFLWCKLDRHHRFGL